MLFWALLAFPRNFWPFLCSKLHSWHEDGLHSGLLTSDLFATLQHLHWGREYCRSCDSTSVPPRPCWPVLKGKLFKSFTRSFPPGIWRSTLLCLGLNLFIFAHVLWTTEIVSDMGNESQQVACMLFLLLLLQPVFTAFYCFSYWQLPPWSPISAFLTLSTGSLFAVVK